MVRNTSAGWAAGLRRLKFLSSRDSPPISSIISRKVVPIGTSTRPVFLIFPPSAKHLRPFTLFAANGLIPLGAVQNDLTDIRIGFYVIQNGGQIKQSLDRREGRPGMRFAAVFPQCWSSRGLLAATNAPGPSLISRSKLKGVSKICSPSSPRSLACSMAMLRCFTATGYSART